MHILRRYHVKQSSFTGQPVLEIPRTTLKCCALHHTALATHVFLAECSWRQKGDVVSLCRREITLCHNLKHSAILSANGFSLPKTRCAALIKHCTNASLQAKEVAEQEINAVDTAVPSNRYAEFFNALKNPQPLLLSRWIITLRFISVICACVPLYVVHPCRLLPPMLIVRGIRHVSALVMLSGER